MLRTISATRYVLPLREGGSLPAIMEADDDGTYVVKFRGAGQGAKALIAEIIAGEMARALGLPVPEIVLFELDSRLAKTEPDPEIQDLLRASEGLNLALDYLPGSVSFDPLVAGAIENNARLASQIVWFDALATNVDRTPRNPNLLVWHKKLWLIDHGAALFFHHGERDYVARSQSTFPQIREHVLLPWASELENVDAELRALLTPNEIARIIHLIPDAWLGGEDWNSAEEHRAAYREYFAARLQAPRGWLQEANDARNRLA